MKEIFFETIRCDDFDVFNLFYHKKRIAKTIGSNLHLEEYIYPPNDALLKCKVLYDLDGIIDIEYSPYNKKKITSFKLLYDNTISYEKKSANREQLDNLYSQKETSDEIIIIKNGLLTDTSIANIAIYYEEKWITPKSPLLFGTTRDRYLENGIISESDITIDILSQATKIALLNAMIDFDTIENFTIEGIKK